jgi:hypothetical protein
MEKQIIYFKLENLVLDWFEKMLELNFSFDKFKLYMVDTSLEFKNVNKPF